MLWVLNGSDGTQSLLQIADRAEIPFQDISYAAKSLVEAGLLRDSPVQFTTDRNPLTH
jgi:aminopeptidase-like protein